MVGGARGVRPAVARPGAGGTPPYAELHCHSAYSFLDGVSLPDELAHRAAELGYGALALTDHDSVSGSMEFAQAAAACGVRAIHGAELDIYMDGGDGPHGHPVAGTAAGGGAHGGRGTEPPGDGRRHLTLLVRDARGWRNLCRLLTLAHAHTRAGPGRERGEPAVSVEAVCAHAEGLVCLTGCATHGVHDEPTARRLLDAFGPESLRVELQRPFARRDRARNRALAALARHLGVACVATGDVHAHARCRAELQDAFVALRHHITLDASEPLRRANHSHVLAAPAAMAARFAEHPDAVRESVRLAEELRFDLAHDLGYRYPGSEDPGAGRRLAELCRARLEERYGAPGAGRARARGRSGGGRGRGEAAALRGEAAMREEAAARLEEELRIIDTLGLAGFFLLHHEMLELAREVAAEVRGPDSARALLAPGRGRGSSVSSIVCYLTGLSHIDPIGNRLLLGRFLHTGLESLPDIDLDFPRDVRERLIRRVHARYGAERAALVAAFPTYRARGAIRELGKVLGLPPGEIERVARAADNYGAAEHDLGALGREGHRGAAEHDLGALGREERGSGAGPAAARGGEGGVGAPPVSPRWTWLARLLAEARGLPRHLSQHPGGMVIATRPLIDCCPVVPAAMEGRQIVQWDKDSCADAGFLKIDLLGLGMLSAVERCVEEIARARGERIDLSRIPFDDPATFRAMRARGHHRGLPDREPRPDAVAAAHAPENLEDLTVQVAIMRPGPIQGGAINPYIERRQRLREDPSYEPPCPHPALREVLRETLGTIIFQDQVIEVARGVRRLLRARGRRAAPRDEPQALQRRDPEPPRALPRRRARPRRRRRRHRAAGVGDGRGLRRLRLPQGARRRVRPARLPVHVAARPLRPRVPVRAAQRAADGLLPPRHAGARGRRPRHLRLPLDVNASAVRCTVEAVPRLAPTATRRGEGGPAHAAGGALGVRLGLGYVKDVRAEEVRALVAERERGGPFCDLGELAARCGAGRPTLEQLAWSGACDGLVSVAGGSGRVGRCSSGRRGARAGGGQLGRAAPPGALAAGDRRPRSRGRTRGHPAGAAAGVARRAAPAPAGPLAAADRRLRRHRGDRRRSGAGGRCARGWPRRRSSPRLSLPACPRAPR